MVYLSEPISNSDILKIRRKRKSATGFMMNTEMLTIKSEKHLIQGEMEK